MCGGVGGGGGGCGRRRRVGEAGGRVVPVHRGGCVGRAGSSGGSSRAQREGGGGGRGGGGGGGEGSWPPHMAPAGGRAKGALAGLCRGNPAAVRGEAPAGRQGSGGIRGRDSRRRRRRSLRPMLVDFPGCTSRPPPPRGLAPPPLGAPRPRLAGQAGSPRGLRRHRHFWKASRGGEGLRPVRPSRLRERGGAPASPSPTGRGLPALVCSKGSCPRSPRPAWEGAAPAVSPREGGEVERKPSAGCCRGGGLSALCLQFVI